MYILLRDMQVLTILLSVYYLVHETWSALLETVCYSLHLPKIPRYKKEMN
jgi:hypothetical protein